MYKFLAYLKYLAKLAITIILAMVVYYNIIEPWLGEGVLWDFINKHFLLVLFGGAFLYGFLFTLIPAIKHDLGEYIREWKAGNSKAGEHFENSAAKKLENVFNAKPLQNVLIPIGEGKTTEADMLFVTTKGIFCIECKYHEKKGIYHSSKVKDDEWTLNYDTCVANPFNQNAYHIRNLKSLLAESGKDNVPVYNIVASTASLERIFDIDGQAHCTTRTRHWSFFKEQAYCQITLLSSTKTPNEILALPDVLGKDEVSTLTSLLKKYCGTEEERKAHAQRVQWETIKRILPHTTFYIVEKNQKLTTGIKATGRQRVKLTLDKMRKKYTILYIDYLSYETKPRYTYKYHERKYKNPYYVAGEKDIVCWDAMLKDAYITDYKILSYKEALKHPDFKLKSIIIACSQDNTYESFFCFIRKVDKAPEKYKLYLPQTKTFG